MPRLRIPKSSITRSSRNLDEPVQIEPTTFVEDWECDSCSFGNSCARTKCVLCHQERTTAKRVSLSPDSTAAADRRCTPECEPPTKRAATASSKCELEAVNQVPVKQLSFELSSKEANIDFTKFGINDLSLALTMAVLLFAMKHDGDLKGTITRIDGTHIINYEVRIEKSGIKMKPNNYDHANLEHKKELYITMNLLDFACSSLGEVFGFHINPTRLSGNSKNVSTLCLQNSLYTLVSSN